MLTEDEIAALLQAVQFHVRGARYGVGRLVAKRLGVSLRAGVEIVTDWLAAHPIKGCSA